MKPEYPETRVNVRFQTRKTGFVCIQKNGFDGFNVTSGDWKNMEIKEIFYTIDHHLIRFTDSFRNGIHSLLSLYNRHC